MVLSRLSHFAITPSQRVELLYIALQLIEYLLLVIFRGTDIPVAGHILRLAQVVYFHPMRNDGGPDLIEVPDRSIYFAQVRQHHARHAVKIFPFLPL